MGTTRFLTRPEGRLAYDDTGGVGPLVVAIPGMGDLRSEYRFLAPVLVRAGFRVVTMDLRGHGDSDATFTDVERASVGDDLLALLEELGGGPAHLIGCSFGAAAAVWAAAHAPERVLTVTLIGPFVQDHPTPAWQRIGMRLMLARPWGARAWAAWFAKLHVKARPDDFGAHVAGLRASLADPRRLAAVRAMGRTSTAAIDPLLDGLAAPTTVVMGTADPDFADPAAEAAAIARRTGGSVVLVDGAGHYPHVEDPVTTGPAVLSFLNAHAVA
jgi:pimeloyl-ACP methyl ester carboxylesterase